jgi:hypothetical protein
MTDIEQRFIDEARRQLEAERAREFDRLVKERAIKLQGEHQCLVSSDFPTGRDEGLARIAELEKRHTVLQRKRPNDRSAAEDGELDSLVLRLGEMRKRARTLGWLPKEAA